MRVWLRIASTAHYWGLACMEHVLLLSSVTSTLMKRKTRPLCSTAFYAAVLHFNTARAPLTPLAFWPAGFVSRQLVRTAALALGPWLALLAVWASMRVAAQRSLRARHLLLANTYVPVLMMGRHGVPPIKIKRDEDLEDSADEWQQSWEWRERGQKPDVLKAEHGKQREGKWWPLRRDLLRRRGSLGSLEGQQKGPAALASSAASGGLPFGASLQRLRPALLALGALLLLVAGLCAALGAALYLRPYLLPYRALAVEGQYSQFTLVSMSYDARMSTLRHMVRHYSRCPSVAEIVLVWNKGRWPVRLVGLAGAGSGQARVLLCRRFTACGCCWLQCVSWLVCARSNCVVEHCISVP